ncbi:MAG: manganese efflux pump MntP family protein [Heliobacteriaceae bacterium]|nr:manganese efflux pump MntP family protein [Heliobacteriaceae bacterium]
MSLIELIFLALALGTDCFVVSFSQGCIFRQNRLKNSVLLALTMGLFQGVMPFIGYFGASFLYNYVESYSRWLVFGIFMILGLKFIFEAFEEKEDEAFCIGFKCLVALGVATSIDALAAGAGIRLAAADIVFPAVLIGIVSFLMSLGGFWSGNCIRNFPSKYLEILGGLILISLAVKALL